MEGFAHAGLVVHDEDDRPYPPGGSASSARTSLAMRE